MCLLLLVRALGPAQIKSCCDATEQVQELEMLLAKLGLYIIIPGTYVT